MNPDEINNAVNALQTAVQTSAETEGKAINADAALLAPGLSTGTNAPGGYNYQRTVAPIIDPLKTNMVIAAKQGLFKQALKDAQHVAQVKYDDANYGYKQRQRDYTKKQVLEAKERQRKADAQTAAYYSSSRGGGGGGSYTVTSGGGGAGTGAVGGVTTTANKGSTSQFKYSGNADFRGYLAANGYGTMLAYTGNDGKIDVGKVNKFGADTPMISYAPGQAGKVQAQVSAAYAKYKAAGGR